MTRKPDLYRPERCGFLDMIPLPADVAPQRRRGRNLRGCSDPIRVASRRKNFFNPVATSLIAKLFWAFEKPSLAQLPLFVGCQRINESVDFPIGQFSRLRGFFIAHSGSSGARKPKLDKSADCLGAYRFIHLPCCPVVHIFA